MDYMEFAIKVQQIAKIGLMYSKDPYAIDNYQILEELSRNVLNDGMVHPPIQKNIFERDIYPTPNSSVRVIVMNERNEVLMVKEADDQGWAVPGGWCEIYMGLIENAKKEVKEEAGIDVLIGPLLGIYRREVYKNYPSIVSEYVHYFAAKPISNELLPNHETLEVKYFPWNDLPSLSRKNSEKELSQAFRTYFHQSEIHID